MKSPITGSQMQRKNERREFTFRKEQFIIIYQYYVCKDSGEQFTDEEMDNLNLMQVHNQYRAKYGIPFIDEIKNIRHKYELSAAKMSQVLGFGVNIYRQYEGGEMPSIANGRLIRMCEDPMEFLKLLQLSHNSFETHEFEKVKKKIEHALQCNAGENEHLENWLFTTKFPNVFNGFKTPSLKKIGNMVKFFAHKNRPYTTALNKLMFYADLGHYKKYGTGISGLTYQAIQKGPVPANYGTIYNAAVNFGYVNVYEIDFQDFVGEQFRSTEAIDPTVFSESEIEFLEMISAKFKGWSTKDIVHASHLEKAWHQNVDEFGSISYLYSFELKNID